MRFYIRKYITPRRCWNYVKLRVSYRLSALLKIPFHSGGPAYLQVEPVNFCNLRCLECPAGNGTLKRTRKEMSLSLYQKIIDESVDSVFSVLLYLQGEPFLYANLPQMIKYAHERCIFTYTSTNGHFLLDNVLVDSIIKSGLDHIVISVDGTTQQVYEKYRKGGNLAKVLDGIDNLIERKKLQHSSTPYIEVQMVVTAENENQVDDFKTFFSKKNVQKISLKTAQIYDFENGNALMPSHVEYSRYEQKDGKFRLKGKLQNRCWKQWSSVVVTSDGDMVPCCFDKNAEHTFGNVKENSLLSVWKSKSARQFRKMLLRHRKDIDICQNCSEVK